MRYNDSETPQEEILCELLRLARAKDTRRFLSSFTIQGVQSLGQIPYTLLKTAWILWVQDPGKSIMIHWRDDNCVYVFMMVIPAENQYHSRKFFSFLLSLTFNISEIPSRDN